MRLHTWKPPESLRIGPVQSMNRCTPPADWITLAPGRRRRWKALTTTPSTPTARRSSLLTPRTPARVASGRNVGTGSVPRRVASGSTMQGIEGQHEDELVRDRCLLEVNDAPDVGHEPIQPAPIGGLHAAAAPAQGSGREADDRVVDVEAAEEARGGVRGPGDPGS